MRPKRVLAGLGAILISSWLFAAPAGAANSLRTGGSASISEAASVTVVTNAPLQILLASGSIAPSGVTFTVAGSGAVAVPGFVSAAADANSLLVSGNGLMTGTTMNGEALSVSVGDGIGDEPGQANTGGNTGVKVVVAQFN
ncbi:MAG TPA: hypothetical protein VNT77_09760 [Allosphingosinicella sp.]|nr:hypothetical protein [Allosphingosinicella sp.]